MSNPAYEIPGSIEYVIPPITYIECALRWGLLQPAEVTESVLQQAEYAAEELAERYAGSDEGFGSSDRTYAVQSFVRSLGILADFVPTPDGGNKLTRLEGPSRY